MIFQQPTSALNPVYRAGAQIKEVFELHRDWSSDVEEERSSRASPEVGSPIPRPAHGHTHTSCPGAWRNE